MNVRLNIPIMAAASLAVVSAAAQRPARTERPKTVYDFTVKDIDGRSVKLSRYRGKVLLIVNVAGKCGLTPQYSGLQSIYEKYRKRGFVILGFPANDFLAQEPGTEAEIKQFCSTNYRVTFPMFSKIVVKGEGQAPLYRFLTSKDTNPTGAGDIEWNFAKFLIGRDGKPVQRFASRTTPTDTSVTEAIEKLLADKR